MDSVRIAIVGGGFSGLGVAIELLRRGIDDFVILEKADQLGGTWRENTYPGCACDVPSQLYSYSYAPKADWSRVFAEQPEIQDYLLQVARDFGVLPFVRHRTEVLEARWQAGAWALQTSRGPLQAQILVAGAGPLHVPKIPALPGRDDFAGVSFHSATWDHDHDLRGRRVAVLGTGSSAIQFVPRIQPEVGALTLFQRTAPWVLPKPDHAIGALQRAMFAHLPGFQRGYRGTLYHALELLQLAQRQPRVMAQVQRIGALHLRRQVQDPVLRRKLTPDFVLGCKRLLLSNTYYPALSQPNVEVVASGVARVERDAVIASDGSRHEVDTIVYATGFEVTDPPIARRVFGEDGRSLSAHWAGSPRAYLGTHVTGFPNLFFMLGPNLGNGHSSAMVLIEAQARYLADASERMAEAGWRAIDVREDVEARYNDEVQAALQGTVWNAGGCASWYLDAHGRNSTIYPWTTIDLRRRLARFDPSRFAVTHARRGVTTELRA